MVCGMGGIAGQYPSDWPAITVRTGYTEAIAGLALTEWPHQFRICIGDVVNTRSTPKLAKMTLSPPLAISVQTVHYL